VLALSLTAFVGAGVAHAEEGGEWSIEGKELKTYEGGKLLVILASGSHLSFLFEIIGRTVRILCTSIEIISLHLGTGGRWPAGWSLRVRGCKTFIGKLNAKKEVIEEAESAPCEPFSVNEKKEKVKGEIASNKLKGVLALNASKETIVLVEPEVAAGALLTAHMSELCSIGEEIPLFGKLALKDSEAAVEKIEHEFTEEPLTSSLWVISATEEHLRTKIDLAWRFWAIGIHLNMKWSGKAN
jgi:hypothetical protein